MHSTPSPRERTERRRLAARAMAALSLALAAAGCASNAARPPAGAPASAANATSPAVAIEAEAVQVVPSGASLHATLDGELSSEHATAGDRFTATLDDPLRALDGATLVPKGATLHGHVLEVGREGIPRLVLQFDTVESGGHAYSIYAHVTRIESARVVPAYSTDATSVAVEVYAGGPLTLPLPEVGGGPPAEQLPLQIAAGAGIELFLSQPLEMKPIRADAP